jgi:prevent-host-death family protein
MHQENIHSAKTNLSKLIARALKGEEVVIARDGLPIARIIPYQNEIEDMRKKRKLGAGFMKGKMWIADDWNSPEFNKEIEDSFFSNKEKDARLLELLKKNK